MSSLNQLISEIAHSVQQADSVPVRRAIRQGIIHARNELIRHVYSNNNYIDKVLKQRYNVTLKDVNDGDDNGYIKIIYPEEAIYNQSHSSTNISVIYPKVTIKYNNNNLQIQGNLFGGDIGFDEYTILEKVENNIYVFKASENNPKYHAEIGNIINSVYFELIQDENNKYNLKAFQYNTDNSKNYNIILTKGGKFFSEYKFIKYSDIPSDIQNIDRSNLIKRSIKKIPRPVRLSNNLPFHSIRTIGAKDSIIIPYIMESSNKFYKHLPGMNNIISYDYINEYLYIYNPNVDLHKICIESIFEYPHELNLEFSDNDNVTFDDDDEFFLPEDLVNSVKKLVLETFNNTVIRDTNEIPTPNLVK